MQNYRGAVIFKSFKEWFAVFSYGQNVRAASRKAAMRVAGNRGH